LLPDKQNYNGRKLKSQPQYAKTLEQSDFVKEHPVQKPKYRLLLSPEIISELETEFPKRINNLENMIKMKFLSLGFTVEVAIYKRLDKHTTTDKTFHVTFEKSDDALSVLALVDKGQLNFKMSEARPSPKYQVNFVVLCNVNVYEGKCFNKKVRELHEGDIVTANQERGNKLRIIMYCPKGCDIWYYLRGWVLQQERDKEQLKRMELVNRKVKTDDKRSSVNRKTPTDCPSMKDTYLRAFRANTSVCVYSGGVGPSSMVICQLPRGAIVYENWRWKSMMGIIKTDSHGRALLKNNGEPQHFGWVHLRNKFSGISQLTLLPTDRWFLLRFNRDMNNLRKAKRWSLSPLFATPCYGTGRPDNLVMLQDPLSVNTQVSSKSYGTNPPNRARFVSPKVVTNSSGETAEIKMVGPRKYLGQSPGELTAQEVQESYVRE